MAILEGSSEHQSAESATYLWVAETVLRKHRRPLRAREIVNLGIDDGLFADRELSKTPQKSMRAGLSIDILEKGKTSKFLRTERGLFFLRELQNGTKGSHAEYTAIRRAAPPPSENVLVIAQDGYRSLLDFQGIDARHEERLRKLLHSDSLTYVPRTAAEVDNNYKQLIT